MIIVSGLACLLWGVLRLLLMWAASFVAFWLCWLPVCWLVGLRLFAVLLCAVLCCLDLMLIWICVVDG